MTREQARKYLREGTFNSLRYPPSVLVKYWTMSDGELLLDARLNPEKAVFEAYSRIRPSMVPVYTAALDTGHKPSQVMALRGLLGLMEVQPASGAREAVVRLLAHRNLDVRAGAAVLLTRNGIRHPSVAKNLRDYLKSGSDGRRIIESARALLRVAPTGGLPLIQAASRRAKWRPSDPAGRDDLRLVLVDFGDPRALRESRDIARRSKDVHARLDALEALARSRGMREIDLLEDSLIAPAMVRTVAMHWLFHFGRKSSVARLRAAARTPQATSGSRAFESIAPTMLDFARRIELGQRGPRPPDRFYRRARPFIW
jgi:hypothetical protein